jgi:hypothetical protein
MITQAKRDKNSVKYTKDLLMKSFGILFVVAEKRAS